jgi:small-conductance mechanosensitive channel
VQLLGIGSVAVGIVFRNTLEDFFAGIVILLDEPFRVDDQIVIDGFEGTIEDIQTRATAIRTHDGRQVIVPNAHLFNNSVVVNTAYTRRRVECDIGIGYGDNLAAARRLVLESLVDMDGILADPPPEVLVSDLGDFSVTLRVRWWITPPRRRDAVDSRDHVLAAIKETLTEHGIDLPFPTYQVLFHDQTEESDGDRRHQREGWPAGGGTAPQPRRIGDMIGRLAEMRMEEVQGSGSAGP